MKLDRKIILSILALGVSPFIMASTESLVGFVLNSSLKEFGDIYISALTILQSAMQFASVPLTGFAQGFVPIISYNYGHGDKQRVKRMLPYCADNHVLFQPVINAFHDSVSFNGSFRVYE